MKRYLLIIAVLIGTTLVSCRPTAVVVKERPVAPVVVRPPQPYPHYVWVEGGWYKTGGRYSYRQGYWAPPRRKAYRPGYWRHTNRGWVWVPGR